MARASAGALKDRLRGGLVIAPSEQPFGTFESIAGGHPIPNEGSERAGRRALQIAESLQDDEALLVLLSGGASALMAVPAEGLSLADKQRTTTQLLRAGADIHALNTVRKHLSAIKGGWLAKRAAGPVRTLAISDVVGDDVSVIASGPTVPDASTFAEARALVDRFGGAAAYPPAVVERLDRGVRGEIPETPKLTYPRLVKPNEIDIIGSRRTAMTGAAARAVALGYDVVRIDEPVVGEARVAGPAHVRSAIAAAAGRPRPVCIVSSGETTVTVKGHGKGGRNQEFVLAALGPGTEVGTAGQPPSPFVSPGTEVGTTRQPPSPFALASAGTDGIDGPTDAAGAIGDSTTMERARAARLDPRTFLDHNDAYAFFDALGDLIHTGPTGTNVGDLQIILLA